MAFLLGKRQLAVIALFCGLSVLSAHAATAPAQSVMIYPSFGTAGELRTGHDVWSTIHGQPDGSVISNSHYVIEDMGWTEEQDGQPGSLDRLYGSYDLCSAGIPSGDIIASATLNFYGRSYDPPLDGDHSVHEYEGIVGSMHPIGNITGIDFGFASDTVYASTTMWDGGWVLSAYNPFVFNKDGIAYLNEILSASSCNADFFARSGYDIDNVQPPDGYNDSGLGTWIGDDSHPAANTPYLELTYVRPPAPNDNGAVGWLFEKIWGAIADLFAGQSAPSALPAASSSALTPGLTTTTSSVVANMISPSIIAESTFTTPYPVVWNENFGRVELDLTGVSIEGFSSGTYAGYVTPTITLHVKITNHDTTDSYLVPMYLGMVIDESGDMAYPLSPFLFAETGHEIGPGQTSDQDIVFAMPSAGKNNFIFTTGGDSNVFFTLSINGYGINVQKELTSEPANTVVPSSTPAPTPPVPAPVGHACPDGGCLE